MYARVSTKDKEQKPENQLIKLREYCKRQGYGVYDEYSEEISGMDKHRPEKDGLMTTRKVAAQFGISKMRLFLRLLKKPSPIVIEDKR